MHLPRDPLGAQRQTVAIARIREYLKGHVEQHRATFDADNIRDYYVSICMYISCCIHAEILEKYYYYNICVYDSCARGARGEGWKSRILSCKYRTRFCMRCNAVRRRRSRTSSLVSIRNKYQCLYEFGIRKPSTNSLEIPKGS